MQLLKKITNATYEITSLLNGVELNTYCEDINTIGAWEYKIKFDKILPNKKYTYLGTFIELKIENNRLMVEMGNFSYKDEDEYKYDLLKELPEHKESEIFHYCLKHDIKVIQYENTFGKIAA